MRITINIFSINITRAERESVEQSEPEQQRETQLDALVIPADSNETHELSSRDGRHDVVWESKQRIGFQRSLHSRG
ncbi:hypothetical protein SEA_SICARIUS2_52 [Arthrobacter phage Sicarius2]|uniref:Uncharacterized protein n=1 Tax=Arthrobacter phage Sicarius2 TaxID=2836090 RepID=A0A8F3E6D9_9CAUD|nr:hypothetical protein SEA_SICARIUS2_52 [Arthrobacter phage Sicarius2]